MSTVFSVIGLLLMFVGCALTLAAAIGLLRFSDLLTRMHPAAKPQVLGLVLVLTGACMRLQQWAEFGMFVLAGLFAIITAPVIANRVSNVGYHESAFVDSESRNDPLEDA